MTKFFYVYILQSEADPQRFYSGLTDDLVFARVVVQSEGCRAVALAAADVFSACYGSRASYDSASQL